jgi:hypothetical protein
MGFLKVLFGDVVQLIVMAVLIIAPFVIVSLGEPTIWWWVITCVAIGAVVGIIELISYLMTGLTISNHFRRWSVQKNEQGKYKNAWKAIATLSCVTLGWLVLMAHLLTSLIAGK